jgi:class 3 adenylate cyclase
MLPVVLVTALDASDERVRGLEAGADDFVSKPVQQAELMARVRSLLRIKSLYDEVERQKLELQQWNRTLEQRVADAAAQLDRVGRLKRFFSPALAEAILAGGADDPLKTHRREITVLFLDLRGFTAFTETADPEEVMGVLGEYHAAMGRLIQAHDGTLERFSGDGMMIFFNDPQPIPDPAPRAARMALAMQQAMMRLSDGWHRRGYALQMGIGIAQGYATIGGIGFEGRIDYGAIGNVTNLAARLCGEAAGGEILASQRVVAALDGCADCRIEPAGELALKGLHKPVPAFRIVPPR